MISNRRWSVFLIFLCLLALAGFEMFAQQSGPEGQNPSALLAGLRDFFDQVAEERAVPPAA